MLVLPRGVRDRDRDDRDIDTIAAELRLERLPSSPARARGEEATMPAGPSVTVVGGKNRFSVGEEIWGDRTGRAAPALASIMFGATGDDPGSPMEYEGGEKPKTVVGVAFKEGILCGAVGTEGVSSSMVVVESKWNPPVARLCTRL